MPQGVNIAWNMGVQITGGPSISLDGAMTVDAYDMIEVVILDNATQTVEIQPSGVAAQVQLLMIRSDRYDEALFYKVGAEATEFKLDKPLLLIGKGAISMLGVAPDALHFTNASGENASIQILVGRDATP